jgi:hypothetical protein
LAPGRALELRVLAALAATLAALTFAPRSAQADEHSIIKNPGDHPHYIFEAEPHAILGFAGPFDQGAYPGLGFRGTFHIADGFVTSINDSVGVGVGIDFAPGNDARVFVPIVMQWNFWLSTHWSVFGEPGIAFGSGGPNSGVYPAFFAGGRFSFTERIALTIRLGYPDVSVGVSFFL